MAVGRTVAAGVGRSSLRTHHGHGYRGPLPDGHAFWEVLRVAWEDGITTSSNFARYHAQEIALAASLGWITVVLPDGRGWEGRWNITAEGAIAYRHREHTQQ